MVVQILFSTEEGANPVGCSDGATIDAQKII